MVAYGSSSQDVYRIRLTTAGYLILKQNPGQAHSLALGRDISNRSIVATGTELYPYLSAGTYYLTVDGAWPVAYSIELYCSVPPASVFGNARFWAEAGTNNGSIQGTLASGANHLELYVQTSAHYRYYEYKPGPERIFRIDLPDDRFVQIMDKNADPGQFVSYLVDTSGNPLDTIHRLEAGVLAAGTYYLSVE